MSATEIVYGVNPVLEMLRAGKRRCHEVVVSEGKRPSAVEQVMKLADRQKVRIVSAAKMDLTRLAGTDRHQGMAARADPYPYVVLEDVIPTSLFYDKKSFFVILDGITDPQNLGSIVRTAHLLGVDGLILPRDNACAVTPAVVKASAGASEYMPISQVTNIANTIKYLQENGVWVAAADADGEKSIYEHDFSGYHFALVLGSEGRGVRRLVRERCDFRLSIPMQGKIDSFNVSVAGALIMGEVARQRLGQEVAKSVPKGG